MSKEQNSHTFWSGFSLGMVAGGSLLYFFATKRGRDTMNKMLKNSETLEHGLEDVLQMLQKHNVFKQETNEEKEEEK